MDDYLQKGIYGIKQTKPEERKKFLGTLRERIVVALTIGQVMERGIYPEVKQQMIKHPEAYLLINGAIDYSHISDYIKCARTLDTAFSIVTNKEHETDIGLVLTYDYAIDKEEIYISSQQQPNVTVKAPKKSLLGKFKNLFKS